MLPICYATIASCRAAGEQSHHQVETAELALPTMIMILHFRHNLSDRDAA